MPLALVTGANRGLGLATATHLARAGWSLVLTSRDTAAGAAAAEVCAATGVAVDVVALDLSSRTSIEAAAASLIARGTPIDLLLNNAGRMTRDPQPHIEAGLVDTGVESILASNVLGPFLFTRRLWPLLAPATEGRGRVVFVGSRTHTRLKPGALSFDDLDSRRGFDPSEAYARSKLALNWLVFALARRAAPRPVHVVCPGLVPATIVPNVKGFTRFLMQHVMPLFPFSHTLDEASGNIAWACTEPSLAGRTGLFRADRAAFTASAEARDEAKQEQMWARACALLDLPTTLTP